MDQVITAALSFPAVIFTVLMGFSLLFWTTVIMGGAEPDSLDPDVHVDGHVDAHFDAHVDAHVDGHVEAHGDVGHGHHDVDGHGHGHHGAGIFGSVLGFMNLGSVPLSMVATVGVLFGWVSSMMIQIYLQPSFVHYLPGMLAGLATFGASGVLSVLGAGLATRPLRGAFKIQTFHAGEALIDQACKITSSRVDQSFGEAKFETKGAPLVLSVRCNQPNKLAKGSDAVIVAYDAKTNIYEVGELDAKNEDVKELEAAADAALKGKRIRNPGRGDVKA